MNSIVQFFSFLSLKKDWRSLFKPHNLFKNYFWVVSINAFLLLFTGKSYLTSILFPIIIYLLVFRGKRNLSSFNLFDVLWAIFFIYNLLTWVVNDYPYKWHLAYRCLLAQSAYMLVYWIPRKFENISFDELIDRSLKPLFLMSILGIYCFIFPPQWYMSRIIDSWYSNPYASLDEFTRLKSIFSSPYEIAYMSSIVLSWSWFRIVKGYKTNFYYIIILLITGAFCMMRAPYACMILSFIMAVIYGFLYENPKTPFKMVVLFLIFGAILVTVASKVINEDKSGYIQQKIEKVTDEDSDFVESRANIYEVKKTLIGQGAGRFAVYAGDYPPNFWLPDSEYLKMLAEVGYMGISLFCLFLVTILLKGFVNFKFLSFETCLVIMAFVTMIGATPISSFSEHSILFWFAFGRISNYRKKKAHVYANNNISGNCDL